MKILRSRLYDLERSRIDQVKDLKIEKAKLVLEIDQKESEHIIFPKEE